MINEVVTRAVKRMGGVAYVSSQMNVSKAYIYMVMNGLRPLSEEFAAHLGLEIKTIVRRKKSANKNPR